MNTYEVITVSQIITVKNCEDENDVLKKLVMKRDVVVEINLIEILQAEGSTNKPTSSDN